MDILQLFIDIYKQYRLLVYKAQITGSKIYKKIPWNCHYFMIKSQDTHPVTWLLTLYYYP